METINRNVSAWRSLSFGDLQRLLDEQGIKVSENASQGSANRKELSAKTKEFRKLEGEEKLDQIKPLLKLYQQEIDNLTSRTKFAESCFLSAYKKLGDAPDPVPLMELASTSATEIEALQKKNKELSEKVEQTSDYNALKKELEAQHKLHEQQLAAKEAELSAYWDERARMWKAKEEDLSAALAENKADVAMLQAKVSGEDNASQGENTQSRALERELERAQSKNASLEARVADLRSELERNKASASTASGLAGLESENAKLSYRLEQLQVEIGEVKQSSQKLVQGLQKQLETSQESLVASQKTVAAQSDYDQILKELTFLRQVEFGEETGSAASGSGAAEASDILSKKNIKLNDDLKNLRLVNKKLSGENDGLQQSVKVLQDQLKHKSQMVEQLEGDLSTISRDETFSTISGWTAVPRHVSPASSIRGGAAGGQPAPLGTAPSQPAMSSDVLNIITQQRDRYKEKVQELEEDLHRCKNMVTSLMSDCEALKKDNAELYSQLRKDKPGKFTSVYDDSNLQFHQLKSFQLDRASVGDNAVDQAIYAVLAKAIVDKAFRYGISAWAVLSHLLLLWLAF